MSLSNMIAEYESINHNRAILQDYESAHHDYPLYHADGRLTNLGDLTNRLLYSNIRAANSIRAITERLNIETQELNDTMKRIKSTNQLLKRKLYNEKP